MSSIHTTPDTVQTQIRSLHPPAALGLTPARMLEQHAPLNLVRTRTQQATVAGLSLVLDSGPDTAPTLLIVEDRTGAEVGVGGPVEADALAAALTALRG